MQTNLQECFIKGLEITFSRKKSLSQELRWLDDMCFWYVDWEEKSIVAWNK